MPHQLLWRLLRRRSGGGGAYGHRPRGGRRGRQPLQRLSRRALSPHALVTRSRAAREKNRLDNLLNVICRADVFILDEVGYLPLESADATFLFEAVGRRYEARKPIILTSNKSYGQWGEIFPDSVLATALLDRLLHHATTINVRGESFRLRQRRQSGLHSSSRKEDST
jgi:hypothetical protein